MKKRLFIVSVFLAFFLGRILSVGAEPPPVVVVLSSNSGPYEEALNGFKETFSEPTTMVVLQGNGQEVPANARLIVAIGGKAATYPYEAIQAPIIYCVAPGIYIDPKRHPGPRIKVYVPPAPAILLQKLYELQPELRRLGVLWMAESAESYGDVLKSEGEKMGIVVNPERLRSVDDLPAKLRSIKGRVDALWIPPDPLLITPQSFAVMRQFSWDNKIPLYTSIDGLADKGASASVAVSFREMGRKAGLLARQALSDQELSDATFYGDVVSVTINVTAATQSGLSIPAAVVKKASRVVP